MGPGPRIAINVVLIYTLFGPVVLLGIYVLFDVFAGKASDRPVQQKHAPRDPALWTRRDLEAVLH